MSAWRNDRQFNHDLLANPDDLRVARELYPTLANALYHPELIDYFRQFSDQADDAKSKSRRLGTWAIILGGAAITMAAVEVAIRIFWAVADATSKLPLADVATLLIVGLIAAVCGVTSLILGFSGILFGERKHRWLINRLMSERIRQFHFQSLIVQLPLIVAMASAGDDKETGMMVRAHPKAHDDDEGKLAEAELTKSFLDERHRRFVEFQASFDFMEREAKFGVAVGPGGDADWRVCEPEKTFSAPESEALRTFFKAYRQLRLLYQLDFANYKMGSDYRIFSNQPRRQSEVLAEVNRLNIQFVTLVHVSVLLIVVIAGCGWLTGLLPDPRWAVVITPIFFFAIMALAVVSLCAHAFAEGLQPEREVERYQQYGAVVKSILERFDQADDASEKIKIMWEMERCAFDEMQNFLITHHERSSFAM